MTGSTTEPDAFFEVAHRLLSSEQRWDNHQLLRAARESELPNTGWPLGLVLQGDGRPESTTAGIRARIAHYGRRDWDDYWELDQSGAFYLLRRFEEDDERFAPEQVGRRFWFDLRVWRIAEAVLHSAALYEALRVPEDEPYDLVLNHVGLSGRELGASSPTTLMRSDRRTSEEQASWTGQVTQAQVRAALPELVALVTTPLFALFDFARLEDGVEAQVTAFLSSRLR